MEYSLRRFPGHISTHEFTINTCIDRNQNLLSVKYSLLDNIQDIMIPEQCATPQRKNGLWNETCFEFFIAVRNSARYWEFNLSPAGHWNVYRFDDYRQGMEEETAFDLLPIKVSKQSESFHLSLEIDLDPIIRDDEAIQAAMSSIIKTVSNNTMYYALSHPGPEPDFHNKEGFIVSL